MVLAKKQGTARSRNNNFPPSTCPVILSHLHQNLTQLFQMCDEFAG